MNMRKDEIIHTDPFRNIAFSDLDKLKLIRNNLNHQRFQTGEGLYGIFMKYYHSLTPGPRNVKVL